MGHNISEVSGRPEMFYVGEKPWHGLGTELQQPATASEAIQSASLDWQVELEPFYVKQKGMLGGYREVPEKQAVVRQDSRDVLGIVSERYEPIQNQEAFSFMDAVIGLGEAVYETAGALGIGEKVWLMAKLPGEMRIASNEDDVIEKYLLLTNFHDGMHSLRVFWTTIRVVCQNTLSLAFSNGKAVKEGIAIRHTGEIKDKVAEAQRVLGLSVKYYDDLSETFNALAARTVSPGEARAYFEALVPDNKKARRSTRTQNIRRELQGLFINGRGNDMPGVSGTGWALLNAVTQYTTHRKSRGSTEHEQQENRLNSIFYGSGADLNVRAFNQALGLLK
ncbi:MAG: DUF932 domain-containing protein [Candidatus Binatota bacterium]